MEERSVRGWSRKRILFHGMKTGLCWKFKEGRIRACPTIFMEIFAQNAGLVGLPVQALGILIRPEAQITMGASLHGKPSPLEGSGFLTASGILRDDDHAG